MPITRKPSSIDDKTAHPVDVEALINRGGSVATAPTLPVPDPAAVSLNEVTTFSVRIPKEMVSKIDRLRGARAVKIPRHTWLLEAIVEKLKRENDDS